MLVMNSHTRSLLGNNGLSIGQLSGLQWTLPAKKNQRLSPLGGEKVSNYLGNKYLFDQKRIHLSLQQKMVWYWMMIQVSNVAMLPLIENI
jgi:hypothetical protein